MHASNNDHPDNAHGRDGQDDTVRTDGRVLCVLIPLYNEQQNVITVLNSVLAQPSVAEVIVVDDASTDGTTQILRTQVDGLMQGVRVLYHEKNLGKGAALRTAIPHATAEFVIVQDGDLEYDPADYAAILQAFHRTGASAVYGSRFMQGQPPMRLPNRIINILLAAMVRVLYATPMTDEATCYKAFRRNALQAVPLHCMRFEFCPEVTAKLIRMGHRIVEAPIHYTPRTAAQGKKIRWTDGVEAIWTLIKCRFTRVA